MAAAICFARVSRAEPLPSSPRWTFAWAVVHANTLTVSTTRVPCWWALEITDVRSELVQPPQPVVFEPSGSFFRRLPARSAPTEK